MNEYFYNLAKEAADIANSYEGGGNIKSEWVYSQWAHETGNFTSELCVNYHNMGGLCQTTDNGLGQPDGDQFYMSFPDYEAYARYFGKYLHYYREDGIYDASTVEEYVAALKHGGYFGDKYENYIAGVKEFLAEFGGVS